MNDVEGRDEMNDRPMQRPEVGDDEAAGSARTVEQAARDTDGVMARQDRIDANDAEAAAVHSTGYEFDSGPDDGHRDPHHDGHRPLRIAVVNDYEVIVRGVAGMLEPFRDRVVVVATEVSGVPDEPADIALFDTFGGHRTILGRAREMVADHHVDRVVLYTWSADVDLLSIARASGVSGVLSKACGAAELVDGLERIGAGERVGLDAPLRLAGHHASSGGVTPQFDLQANLTAREQEVLAMLGLGLSNRDIANELFLGVETVRTYVRQVYQKLGVKNRTQAAVRARVLGLEPATERRSAAAS
jgi:DNA-binding NarL/FixJ family response regulator